MTWISYRWILECWIKDQNWHVFIRSRSVTRDWLLLSQADLSLMLTAWQLSIGSPVMGVVWGCDTFQVLGLVDVCHVRILSSSLALFTFPVPHSHPGGIFNRLSPPAYFDSQFFHKKQSRMFLTTSPPPSLPIPAPLSSSLLLPLLPLSYWFVIMYCSCLEGF